jgi:hypothetical protein
MMCFGESVEKEICDDCKPFIIGSNFIKDDAIQSVSEEIAKQFQSFFNIFSEVNGTGKIILFRKIHRNLQKLFAFHCYF